MGCSFFKKYYNIVDINMITERQNHLVKKDLYLLINERAGEIPALFYNFVF